MIKNRIYLLCPLSGFPAPLYVLEMAKVLSGLLCKFLLGQAAYRRRTYHWIFYAGYSVLNIIIHLGLHQQQGKIFW